MQVQGDMDGLLLLACVLALGVAGGIAVLLYAPGSSDPVARPLARWLPDLASVSVAPVSVAPVSVAPVSVAPVSVAPVSVAAVSVAPAASPPPEPAPAVSARPASPLPGVPTLGFAPVVRSHGALPPLARTRVARGTEQPRVPIVATALPIGSDFVVEDETQLDRDSAHDGPLVVPF